jgi:hypothetical protein
MGKRETQIILKTEERNLLLEVGGDGKFDAKTVGWGENRVFLEDDSSRSRSRTGAGADPPAGGVAADGRAGRALFRYRVGDAVTGCDTVTVTMSPLAVQTVQRCC